MALTYDIKKDIRYQQGKEEGKVEGKVEGEEKKQFEIARNMKQEGLSLELIAKLTGLTEDQLQKL